MRGGSRCSLDVRGLFISQQKSQVRAMFVAVFNSKHWFEPVCANFSPDTQVLSLSNLIPNLIFIQHETPRTLSGLLCGTADIVSQHPCLPINTHVLWQVLLSLSSSSFLICHTLCPGRPWIPQPAPCWISLTLWGQLPFPVLSSSLITPAVTCLASFLHSNYTVL